MNNEDIIFEDSEEAAHYVTNIEGWVSRDGIFYGDKEHIARYSGATHSKCKKYPEHPAYKKNSYCKLCRKEKMQEKYKSFPVVEWDEITPICIFDNDQYFFDPEGLEDYCWDNEIDVNSLNLVLCSQNPFSELDPYDFFVDELPEEGEIPSNILKAFDHLNEVIRNTPSCSWSPSNIAVKIKENK